MNIKQLRTLLAIAETGSVTRASQLLHVVQPALSRHLKLIESELGTQLFDRTNRGMTPTDAGANFLRKVQHALRDLDQARAEFTAGKRTLRGTVSIGLLPSLSEALAVPLMTSLKACHPDLKLRITAGFTGELQPLLERGDLDVAVLGNYSPSGLLRTTPVVRETLFLIGHRLAKFAKGKPIPLSRVAQMPLIVPAYPQGLRELIEQACTIIGVTPNVVAETNSTRVQLEFVHARQGFAILPRIVLGRYEHSKDLVALPVTGPTLYRQLVIAHLVGDEVPPARSIVTELIERHLTAVKR